MRLLLLSVFLAMLAQGDTGRVEIVVRDAGTREAVPGVPMTLTASTGNATRSPTTTILTDPRGMAVFASLPPGAYFMKVDGAGYRTVSFNDYVLIEPGSQRRVEISINQAATVTGRVLDTAGKPLPDSTVYLLSTVYVGGRPGLRLSGRRQQTGPDGLFRLTDIPFGDYYLQIDNSDALASARASDFARYVYYPAATEPSGASRLAVRAHDVAVGDIRVPDARVFKISGTVVNPLGSASATFYLARSNTTPLIDATLLLARFKDSANRSELAFEIGGLVPGSYLLYHLSPPAVGSQPVVVRMVVNIEDRDVEGLRVVVKPNPEIPGRVIWATPAPPAFENVAVRIWPRELLPALLGARQEFVPRPVDSSGAFVVPELVDGVRYGGFAISGLSPDAYVKDIRLANVSILNEGFFVARPSNDSLEIEVASPGGTFHGIVRDAANQAVSKATVVLLPDWTRRGISSFYRRTPTDANGEFNFRGIAPGEYQLFAFAVAPPAGAEEDPNFMAPYTGRGITLRANAGVAAEASLRVIQ